MFNLPSHSFPCEKPLQNSAYALPIESLKDEALNTVNSLVGILEFTLIRCLALSEMMPLL